MGRISVFPPRLQPAMKPTALGFAQSQRSAWGTRCRDPARRQATPEELDALRPRGPHGWFTTSLAMLFANGFGKGVRGDMANMARKKRGRGDKGKG